MKAKSVLAVQAVFVAVILGLATTASAQLAQVFLSGEGKDTFPCTREKPCRTFTAAIAAVAGGGQVIVLDSAAYGPATIDKTLSIVAPPGVYAAATAESGAGVVNVNGSAGTVVVLRGLTITRAVAGAAHTGLRFNGGGELHVENTVIEGPFANGIIAGAPGGRLFIRDTTIRGNIDEHAIEIFGPDTFLDRVHVETTALFGLLVHNVKVTIRDSTFARANQGVHVEAGADVTIENSLFTQHSPALFAAPGGLFRVSNSVIVNNPVGVSGAGERISFGNNRMAGNGADGTFTATITVK